MSRLRPELLVIPLAFTIGLWLLSCRFLDNGSAIGQKLIRASYDLPYLLSGSNLEESEVVVIYLDFRTYSLFGLDPLERFPRTYYATLLNHLRAAGSGPAVFDIVFASGVDLTTDAVLAQAIRDHGNVYLAGEISQSSHDVTNVSRIHTTQLEKPYEPFLSAARGWGLASLAIDQDLVVRRNFPVFPEYNADSLSWLVSRAFPGSTDPGIARWNYYYGPPFTIPHLSLGDYLQNPESYADFITDRVVLIGARPTTTGFGMIQDEFKSPFPVSGRSPDLFHPGVEVHATQILNLIRDDCLFRPSSINEQLILLISSIFLIFLLCLRRPWTSVFLAVVIVFSLFFLASGFFHIMGIWFPWLIIAAVQVPGGLVAAMTNRSLEWYMERRRFLSAKNAADMRIREQASLLDQARDAILVCGLDGRVSWFNRCAAELYGWMEHSDNPGRNAMQGFHFPVFITTLEHPEQFPLLVEETRSCGVWAGEIIQLDSQGNRLTIDSRWTFLDSPGKILMINTDITRKKVVEEQLLRAQRMDTIGAIAGGVAHDLNNILSPILMGVQMLKRHSGASYDAKLLDAIESNTRRGAQMIHQVLAFSKGRTTEMSAVDIHKILVDLEQFLAVTFPSSISIRVIMPKDLWDVYGNTTQIHQVLLNLCINARDAMPHGGELIVAADNAEFGIGDSGLSPDLRPGRYINILVTDSGTGMDQAIQKNIFQPFFTTKPEGKGTGLGLATAMSIVKNHKGSLGLQSEPGRGTTFEIFLPAAIATPPKSAAPPSFKKSQTEKMIVLVVDEENSIRELIHGYLSECGFDVWTAGTGAEALSMLTDSRPQRPALAILSSSLLPFTSSEAWLVQTGDGPLLPVIIVHDSLSPELGSHDPELKLAVLVKPFSMTQLLETIEKLLLKDADTR